MKSLMTKGVPTGSSSPQMQEITFARKQKESNDVNKAFDDWKLVLKHSKHYEMLKKHKHYTGESRSKWIMKTSTSPRNKERIKRGVEYFRSLVWSNVEKSRAVPLAVDRIMFEKMLRFVKESNRGCKWAFFCVGSCLRIDPSSPRQKMLVKLMR